MADPVDDALATGLDPVATLLGGGSVDRVYGAPVQAGEHTIIPAAEVFAAGGSGFGFGRDGDAQGTGGGGGGGVSTARPVAVVTVGPDGVRVRPVLDVTKVALALVAALLAWALACARPRD